VKRCAKCKNELPAEQYGPDRSQRDGRARYCRECKRISDRKKRHPGPDLTPNINAAKKIDDKKVYQKSNGRITSLNATVVELVAEALRRGHTRRAAFAYAGIMDPQGYRWIQSGQERDDDGNPKHPEHAEFLAEVLRAEALGEHHLVECIVGGAQRDHLRAQWVLERRAPEWQRREPGPSSDPDKQIDPEAMRELLSRRITALVFVEPPVTPPTESAQAGTDSGPDKKTQPK
jgi:hypothetical protein